MGIYELANNLPLYTSSATCSSLEAEVYQISKIVIFASLCSSRPITCQPVAPSAPPARIVSNYFAGLGWGLSAGSIFANALPVKS